MWRDTHILTCYRVGGAPIPPVLVRHAPSPGRRSRSARAEMAVAACSVEPGPRPAV